MLTFNYGSPYFWDKVVLTKLTSGCRMVWDLIGGTSWFYKSRTEKVTAGRKSAILPNWCCLFFITVLSGYPCSIVCDVNMHKRRGRKKIGCLTKIEQSIHETLSQHVSVSRLQNTLNKPLSRSRPNLTLSGSQLCCPHLIRLIL